MYIFGWIDRYIQIPLGNLVACVSAGISGGISPWTVGGRGLQRRWVGREKSF